MAYYRRRRSSYRRRRSPIGFLKVIAVLLVVAVCGGLVLQTARLRDASSRIVQLEQQLKNGTPSGSDHAGNPSAPAGSDKAQNTEQIKYQQLYPEMKAENTAVQFAESNSKAVYLTFDDGPSTRTAVILDALKEKGQKATFFVVGKNIAGREELLRRIVQEGHTVGIHGYSHDYNATYASVEDFLKDFQQAYQAVYDACGIYPQIFRFPGGSVNAYNRGIYQEVIAEMIRRGFVYYDWNVSSEDATGKTRKASQITETVMDGIAANPHPIVLMHDAADKKTTADAVPQILDQLSALGYYADKLDNRVRPVTFGYSN